jgi:hypothetical protein
VFWGPVAQLLGVSQAHGLPESTLLGQRFRLTCEIAYLEGMAERRVGKIILRQQEQVHYSRKILNSKGELCMT